MSTFRHTTRSKRGSPRGGTGSRTRLCRRNRTGRRRLSRTLIVVPSLSRSKKGAPVDCLELVRVPQKRRLLDRDLVEEPLDELSAADRVGGQLEKSACVLPGSRSPDRRLERPSLRGLERDSALEADELRDLLERLALLRHRESGARRSRSRNGATSSIERTCS